MKRTEQSTSAGSRGDSNVGRTHFTNGSHIVALTESPREEKEMAAAIALVEDEVERDERLRALERRAATRRAFERGARDESTSNPREMSQHTRAQMRPRRKDNARPRPRLAKNIEGLAESMNKGRTRKAVSSTSQASSAVNHDSEEAEVAAALAASMADNENGWNKSEIAAVIEASSE